MPFNTVLDMLQAERQILQTNQAGILGQEQTLFEIDLSIKLLKENVLHSIALEEENIELKNSVLIRIKETHFALHAHQNKFATEGFIRTRNANTNYLSTFSNLTLALTAILVATAKFSKDEETPTNSSGIYADILT